MTDKRLPLPGERLEAICSEHPTPFHLYDERAIRDNARRLLAAFSVLGDGFKEFFAVKALPNPFILKILAEEGFGADASSLPEIVLAQKAGIRGEDIMFSSNDTPSAEFVAARAAGAIVNLDDILISAPCTMPRAFPSSPAAATTPARSKKATPSSASRSRRNTASRASSSFEGYRQLKAMGARRFGLHTMVASNELNPDYFVETGRLLFELVAELSKAVGIRFEFVNLGGGIGIPYRPEQDAVPLEKSPPGSRPPTTRSSGPQASLL